MADDHQPWSRWLIAYHDGELSPAERERFLEHLATCPRCQHALADLESLRRALHTVTVPWSEISSADEMWTRVAMHLERRRANRLASAPWLHWLPSMGLLLLNVVTHAAGLLIVIVMVLSMTGLVNVQRALGWADRVQGVPADQVLSWVALRSLGGPLGWGANMISLPPGWDAAVEFVLSTLAFILVAFVVGLAYMLSLWLLWRRGELT
ncbi:MAG: zf-HC2 domain-containing protein [Anaerolineae bacterium]|nr:zf-HC2 domain-containing protein [Anaerolineae bacterium]